MNTEHKIPSPRVIYPGKTELKRSNNVRQKIIGYTATAAAVAAIGIGVGLYVSPNSVTVSLSPLDSMVDKEMVVERNLPGTTVLPDDNTKIVATLPHPNAANSKTEQPTDDTKATLAESPRSIDTKTEIAESRRTAGSKTKHTTDDTKATLAESRRTAGSKTKHTTDDTKATLAESRRSIDTKTELAESLRTVKTNNDRLIIDPTSRQMPGTLVAKGMNPNIYVDNQYMINMNIDVQERELYASDCDDRPEINSIRDLIFRLRDKERLAVIAGQALDRYKENFKNNTAWIPEALALQKEEFATTFRRR